MNLPFTKKEATGRPEGVKQLDLVPPTTLLTQRSAYADLVPPMPERYKTKTLAECAANGMFEGLDDIGFDLTILAFDPGLKQKMLSREYEIPDFIWGEINAMGFEKLASVIYTMVRFIHARRAYAATGCRRLILELAGEDNFLDTLDSIKPLLGQWGLDKGRTEANGLEYPGVVKLFLETRNELFRLYGLSDYIALGEFILDNPLDYWPDELVEPLHDSRVLLEAMSQVGECFASDKIWRRR